MKLTSKQRERALKVQTALMVASNHIRDAKTGLEKVYRDTINGSNVPRERDLLPLIYGCARTAHAQADLIQSIAFVHSKASGLEGHIP